MKTIAPFAIAMLASLGVWALPLQFTTQTTNNSTCNWVPWTNGVPLRYNFYWTVRTNTDTGTNWATTTNWSMFVSCNSSTTNTSLARIPTNTYVTMTITVPGGETTIPVVSNGTAYLYWGYPGILITNQPVAP